MTNPLPPYPTGDLSLWATQIVAYLQERDDALTSRPTAVGLAFQTGDERAAVDGILMFDPVLESVVVSKEGAWRPITDYLPKDQPSVGDGIVWDGDGWVSTDLRVAAGYGGIRQSAPVALPDIGAGWTILQADTSTVTTPRGVTQLPASNALAFEVAGVWQLSINASLSHNELNASRSVGVRLFNLTDGTGEASTLIGVGRNMDTTTFSLSILLDVAGANLTDDFQVQIGGGDTLSSVMENSFSYSVNLVSEFRG